MNYHPCETPGCKRSTYHPNRPLCLECESAKIDAEREMIETEKSLKAGGICSECGVDDLFEDEE